MLTERREGPEGREEASWAIYCEAQGLKPQTQESKKAQVHKVGVCSEFFANRGDAFGEVGNLVL